MFLEDNVGMETIDIDEYVDSTTVVGPLEQIQVDGSYYVCADVASPKCWCRRCRDYKQDYGGCIPAWAFECLMQFIAFGFVTWDTYAMYYEGYWR